MSSLSWGLNPKHKEAQNHLKGIPQLNIHVQLKVTLMLLFMILCTSAAIMNRGKCPRILPSHHFFYMASSCKKMTEFVDFFLLLEEQFALKAAIQLQKSLFICNGLLTHPKSKTDMFALSVR